MMDEQVADLRHEGFEVCILQEVELIAEVIMNATRVTIPIQIGDGHEGIKELGTEQT